MNRGKRRKHVESSKRKKKKNNMCAPRNLLHRNLLHRNLRNITIAIAISSYIRD
jgi:hypothetical protein